MAFWPSRCRSRPTRSSKSKGAELRSIRRRRRTWVVPVQSRTLQGGSPGQRALSHPLQRRLRIARGDPAQIASMGGIVVGAAAMQRAAVVPDDQVADAPAVPVYELALRCVLHE